jgi:hypothetical protein
MGRIGQGLCKIIDFATGDYKPAYEHYNGYIADQALDDINKMRLPISNTPFAGLKPHYGGNEMIIKEDIIDRLKNTSNKSEYDYKVGKRCEGLQLAAAMDKPFINLERNAESNVMAIPLGEFSDKEQALIRNDMYPDIMIRNTNFDEGTAKLQKTETPYPQNMPQSELDFIDNDGGEYFLDINNKYVVDAGGSNVRADAYEVSGQPVGDRTKEELFAQQTSDHTQSAVNMRQQNNFKARQEVGLYSGMMTQGSEKQSEAIARAIERTLLKSNVGGQYFKDMRHRRRYKKDDSESD